MPHGHAERAIVALLQAIGLSCRLYSLEKQSHWTPGRIWRRIKEVLRQERLGSLWFKLLGETVYRRLLLVERVLEGGDTCGDETTGRLSLLGAGDLPRHALFRPDADLNDIGVRLDRGDLCFAMSIGDEIAHACWITGKHAQIDYLECEVMLRPDGCLAYDAYTKPAFRGRGIAGARTRRMEPHLMKCGYRRLLSVIGPENRQSLYFNTAAGHQIVGVMGYYQLGAWRRYFCRPYPGSAFTPLQLRRAGADSSWSEPPAL